MNQEEGRRPGQGPAPNTQPKAEPLNRSTRPFCRLARVFVSIAMLAVAAGFAGDLTRDGHTGMALIVILAAAAIIAVVLPTGGRS